MNMGDSRATHASHRASLRCLGLSVGIAIALVGCDHPSPSAVGKAITGEAEAGLTCYLSAEDYVAHKDVAAALRDGLLTGNECDRIVMPYVRASNNAAFERIKLRAVRAASGMEAGTGETRSGSTAKPRQPVKTPKPSASGGGE